MATGPRPTLDQEQKERLIRSSFIFRDLPTDLLDSLARLSRPRFLPKGTLLFNQGDDAEALYAVAEGLIRISVAGDLGRELTLGLMEPGDVFGEIALLDGLPRTASAHAADDSVLLEIQRARFVELLEKESRLARHIIELLCERLRDNTDKLSDYAFLGLRERLARKLQALAIGHGREEARGVSIDLKLSQTDLAQMLGVTREAINRQLKTWAQDGIVEVEHGHITVLDSARLTALTKTGPE